MFCLCSCSLRAVCLVVMVSVWGRVCAFKMFAGTIFNCIWVVDFVLFVMLLICGLGYCTGLIMVVWVGCLVGGLAILVLGGVGGVGVLDCLWFMFIVFRMLGLLLWFAGLGVLV